MKLDCITAGQLASMSSRSSPYDRGREFFGYMWVRCANKQLGSFLVVGGCNCTAYLGSPDFENILRFCEWWARKSRLVAGIVGNANRKTIQVGTLHSGSGDLGQRSQSLKHPVGNNSVPRECGRPGNQNSREKQYGLRTPILFRTCQPKTLLFVPSGRL